MANEVHAAVDEFECISPQSHFNWVRCGSINGLICYGRSVYWMFLAVLSSHLFWWCLCALLQSDWTLH